MRIVLLTASGYLGLLGAWWSYQDGIVPGTITTFILTLIWAGIVRYSRSMA